MNQVAKRILINVLMVVIYAGIILCLLFGPIPNATPYGDMPSNSFTITTPNILLYVVLPIFCGYLLTFLALFVFFKKKSYFLVNLIMTIIEIGCLVGLALIFLGNTFFGFYILYVEIVLAVVQLVAIIVSFIKNKKINGVVACL